MSAAPGSYFSPDYTVARGRFQKAARAAGARLDTLALEARGPGGEALAIDIAWLGAADATRVMLHTSGMHGVEAYAGSAVQLAALADPVLPPAGCALALVHVLNPWGMAWLRRVNENNVDLNRNFRLPGELWTDASPLYDRIDPLLNPPSPPGPESFALTVALLVLRHGMGALRQAVAEGQYKHSRGLFYGGTALQPGPQHYGDWLARNCGRVRYLFALDVHTGLGRWGESSLFLDSCSVTPAATLAGALKASLIDPAADESGYVTRGSMGPWLPRMLPAARVDFLLQELGTYPVLKVFRALREENRWHHYGTGTLDHPAKRGLLEALSPAAPAWRDSVVGHGLGLLRAACAWTFREQDRPPGPP